MNIFMILLNLFHKLAKQQAKATAMWLKKTYYVMSPGTTAVTQVTPITAGKPQSHNPGLKPIAKWALRSQSNVCIASFAAAFHFLVSLESFDKKLAPCA